MLLKSRLFLESGRPLTTSFQQQLKSISTKPVGVFSFSLIFQFLKRVPQHIHPQHNIQDGTEHQSLFPKATHSSTHTSTDQCCFFHTHRKGKAQHRDICTNLSKKDFAYNFISLLLSGFVTGLSYVQKSNFYG